MICLARIQRITEPVVPRLCALTTVPTITWGFADDVRGAESFGLSGSPFVEPLEPVAATAVGTWTLSVIAPTQVVSARIKATVFNRIGAIALLNSLHAGELHLDTARGGRSKRDKE